MNAEEALRQHLDGKSFSMRYDNGAAHVVDTSTSEVTVKKVPPSKWPPRMRDILQAAAEVHGMTPEMMVGGGRYKDYGRARWVFYSVARLAGYSLPVIADAVGGHHTSVLHGLRVAHGKNPDHTYLVGRVIEVVRKRFPEWRI